MTFSKYNPLMATYTPPLYVSRDRGTFGRLLQVVIIFLVFLSALIRPCEPSPTKIFTTPMTLERTDTERLPFITRDGGFCSPHNSGQTYTKNWSFLVTSVESDSTGQYVFILTDKYLQYSSDYASTWTVLPDFTVSDAPVVTPTFLKITSDNKYVYL